MYFPIFVNMQGRKAVVFGGGRIATGRAEKLQRFGCVVRVVAPLFSERLQELSSAGFLELVQDVYRAEYLQGAFCSVAATNVREVNAEVGRASKSMGVLSNVADCKDESDFFFAALFENEDIIGGLVSKQGNQHSLVKEQAEKIREFVNGGIR